MFYTQYDNIIANKLPTDGYIYHNLIPKIPFLQKKHVSDGGEHIKINVGPSSAIPLYIRGGYIIPGQDSANNTDSRYVYMS